MIEKTPEEIKQLLEEEEGVKIIDVREDWEYEICHLDNSIHIPLLQVEEKADTLNKEDTLFYVYPLYLMYPPFLASPAIITSYLLVICLDPTVSTS